MRLSITFYIVLTTLVLVAVAIMSALEFPFSWILYTTIGGQILLLIMVYKILTDDYHTDKTFEDWYEDKPINRGGP